MAETKKRKTIAERRAEIESKIKKRQAKLEEKRKATEKLLKDMLAQLAERERVKLRKSDAHLKIVIGAGVMAHAREHAEWRMQLQGALRLAVTNQRDKPLVDEWFQRLDAELKSKKEKQEQNKARSQK